MEELFEILNIEPMDKRVYEIAVSHSSYANEHKAKKDYERLEFLGDAVVDLVVADYLYSNHNENEGEMTKVRASYVCENANFCYATALGLPKYILVGHGEQKEGAPKKAIVADIFEAFIGAMYLDKGLEFTSNYLNDNIIKYINNNYEFFHDYKTKLQELVQTDKKSLEYIIVREEGPAHDRTFEVEVRIDGILYGTGVGNSKKKAEQEAAKEALEKSAKNA